MADSLRIVSLLPSATEIVCALGLESSLVGRSHECDFPAGIERLPVCTSPKVGGRDTREIHASVSAILQHDLSVYSVDGALLRELAPTHIVTQIQCEVCAVSLRDVEAALADWSGVAAPRIVALNPQSLEDVFDDIRGVGAALDADGETLVTSMKSRMRDAVTPSVSEGPGRAGGAMKKRLRAAPSPRPLAPARGDTVRMAVIEWIEPLMTAGNWMPTLVAMAGGVDVLGKAGAHSEWMTWEQLGAADPDLIVVAPCGFRIEDSQRDWHFLTSNPMWRTLRAVRNGDVFVADGNQYFNRPGPRLVESLEILARIFDGVDSGPGWQRCAD
jgi:iron complex transport system substrate-binding protein